MKTTRLGATGLLLALVVAGAGCSVETETGGSGSGDSAEKKDRSNKKSGGKSEPKMTSSQRRAVESAENYLDISGFSKAGLMQQLSSSAGDGFSKADAKFAVNNVDVDWKKEAVESAKNYLDISPMSKSALIEQLSSSAGDKFTPAQARYAAEKVY